MRYKLLGKSGLKVSELSLGTMGFGQEWKWGADKETSFKILEAYAAAGGNFLDTANRYTEGTSEKIIGEFMTAHDRDYFVVATKYSLFDNLTNPNASGNNRKNMMRSVEQSLKRLNTDYIDLLYLHIWDNLTTIDEVMRGLDDLVRQGKVNYIAISDTPAWIISRGNTLAELMGWSQFVALQVEYSLLQRTPERELIPMAKHYGMTVTPWAPLAGGALTGKYLKGDRGRIPDGSKRLNERSVGITRKVMEISEQTGVPESHVALKWTMQRGFSSIPIVGATKLSQLEENLKAIYFELSPEQIAQLDAVSDIELGFPGDFFKEEGVKSVVYGGFYDKIEHRQP
ncbi:aldo/keto reductase [Flavihumibacter rivuli]|uniref:aldo/keto reductase n=1 Tax=Flavihumibacter rivuli TaxID=2838156 RepID=UPI001BDE8B01|nr:aldo/keto reductase [Flavihumibacter rivuli]ULQ56409.1 aldo/keto reductase [Flavihumibacter rivuli]